MLIAQDAQRRRGQDKMARVPGGQAQPARGQDAEEVAVAEDHHVALHRPQARQHPVGTGTHRLNRLAARTAVAEEIPAWARLANVRGALPLVVSLDSVYEIRTTRACLLYPSEARDTIHLRSALRSAPSVTVVRVWRPAVRVSKHRHSLTRCAP